MILLKNFAHEVPYADLHDSIEVLLCITRDDHPPIPSTLPSYLYDLIEKCWEEDPHLHPTFHDFVKSLPSLKVSNEQVCKQPRNEVGTLLYLWINTRNPCIKHV